MENTNQNNNPNNIQDNYNNHNNYNNQNNYYQGNNYDNNNANEKSNKVTLIFIHFLCLCMSFVGYVLGGIKHIESEGREKENIANLLNFHISVVVNIFVYFFLTISSSVMFTINEENLFAALLFLFVTFASVILFIVYTISFFIITIKVFNGKDIKKMPFTYKFFKK